MTYNLQLTTYNKFILSALIFSLMGFLIVANFAYGQAENPFEVKTGGTLKTENLPATPPTPKAGFKLLGEDTRTGGSRIIRLPNPLGTTSTFPQLINRIINWLLVISAPILVLMIIIGAFQIMAGAQNPENIVKGKHTITWAVIGYALLLVSSGITAIIENLLSGR